jgi:hypothetical protein
MTSKTDATSTTDATSAISDRLAKCYTGVVHDIMRAMGHKDSEELGHLEFILTCKSFEPIAPACLPAA